MSMSSNFGTRVCITGPHSSGKTSLLFQQALSWAEQGASVLFLAPSPLESLPLLPQSSSASLHPPSHLLQRIHFKYPANISELLQLLSNLHITTEHSASGTYHSIAVDDFHNFFPPQIQVKGHGTTSPVAQACAYIIDAVDFLEKRNEIETDLGRTGTARAALTLSTQTHHGVKIETIRRWFPTVLQISVLKEKDFVLTSTAGTLFQYHFSYPHFQYLPPNNPSH